MKKVILIAVVMLLCIPTVAFAQLKYGGGLSLGTKSALDDDLEGKLGFGINLRVDYAINEKFSVVPNFTFWLPSKVDFDDEEFKLSIWKLNADAHYIFTGDDSMGFYGIGGLNYTSAKMKYEYSGLSDDETESEIGVNLGVGAIFSGMFFGELIFDTAGNTEDGQIVLTVGVLF